jgi:hypothetical protein
VYYTPYYWVSGLFLSCNILKELSVRNVYLLQSSGEKMRKNLLSLVGQM